MAISIGHRCGETAEALTNVMAGCAVRFRLRLTDGGVALDWTDPLVSFGDVCVWSQARQGIIARPGFSFDEDDPTLLDVVHTTSTKDLPGPHKLLVTVRYNGWTAVHTVLAYNLVNNLYGGGASLSAVEGYAEEAGPVDVTLALHEIDTTYLQCLIDAMVRLRKDENERICTLETLSEGLRADVDAIAAAIDTYAEAIKANAEDIAANAKAIAANAEAIAANAKATDALTERMEKAEGSIGTLLEGMTNLTQTVTKLVKCCSSVNETLDDLEERVKKLEEGGTSDPDPDPEPDPEPEPEPEYATLTITPDPSDATVLINGEERTELTAEVGTAVEWSVSMEGYVTQSGTLTLTEDVTLPVGLEKEEYTITFNVSPADATLTFNVSPADVTLTVNGSAVALTDGKYTMTAKWGDTISWSCEKDGYISQSGSHTVDGDSTITITLEEMQAAVPSRIITFNVLPNDATLTVNGSEVTLSDGVYTMTAKDGDYIEWSCACDGYVGQNGDLTVNGDETINVTLSSGKETPLPGEEPTLTFSSTNVRDGATFTMDLEGVSTSATCHAWIDGYTPTSGEQVVFDIDGDSYTLYGEDNKTSIRLSAGVHTCSVTHSHTLGSTLSYGYKLCITLSGTTYEVSVSEDSIG